MLNVLHWGNDSQISPWYRYAMAEPRHDWYLKQWLKTLGVTQQWVADQLNKQKSEISRKVSGTTPYSRDDVNTMARLLHLHPYELLMHPDDAMAIRSMKLSASRLDLVENDDFAHAAETRTAFRTAPPSLRKRIGE